MKHDFEERRSRKKENAERQIRKNQQKADSEYKRADEIAKFIPPGQPILVGHHSEKRHRADLNRIDNAMRGARTATEKAEYYADCLHAMNSNTSISSDDPEAIPKLTAKLEKLQSVQKFMKQANKYIRKKDKEGFLTIEFGTEELWNALHKPDCFGNLGFASYKMTNNNANIKRIDVRIKTLQHDANRRNSETTIKGVRRVLNSEANRVQLIFPGKPPQVIRDQLHKQYHFRWCESEGAWQRFYNNAGVYAADEFLKSYQPWY